MNRRFYYIGLAILIASIPFHQPLLVVIGLLVLVIIGTTDIWSTYCLRQLSYQRQFSEQRVLFGEQITLSLAVENAKLLPLPWLEIEDTVPRALTMTGQHTRVSIVGETAVLENLFSTRWYERVTRRYTLQCNARGVHKFGPTRLRSGDVFGFISNEESLENWQYLLVYPLVVPLTRFSLPARHPFGDRRAPRRLLEDPSRVIGVRDYVYGDSLRRIHWKATARTLQLQSKVYEPTTTYTMILFLNVNTQFDTVYGLQPELQELAICAAASVSNWALNEGYAVGLYANTLMFMPEESVYTEAEPESKEEQELSATVAAQLKRRRIHLPPATSEEQRSRIMDVLARIQPYFGSTLEDIIHAERSRLPAGATIVVITSTINDQLLDTLARLKQSGHAVTILFVGDNPSPTRLAGLSIYPIGGKEAWEKLEDAYSTTDDKPPLSENVGVGLQL
ncbi:MAG TPA: DUF58 domain-containing protein [Ktedonobacter sp.]|jgi:uncharacterized protein (DUF58 family)|nr:DUF58 domain-containing protein [Ktedonobacter sp.]HBE24272.1 DUF58 domain-containing protein [Ktedonobacter sp.]HBE27325.1 DUF58 domain-containing protein [Ktedonobacter sp.]HCF84957.1 DUF58 domain-containing protein [Ktedonobacter sp.]